MNEKELTHQIEDLGDHLGSTIERTKSLYETILADFGMNQSVVDIFASFKSLLWAEKHYTSFHSNVFNLLNNINSNK